MYYASLTEERWLGILDAGRPESRLCYKDRSEKEEKAMKWGGFNREGEKKMKKLFGGKVLYVLLTIAAAGLLMSECLKWRPG
jgi:hypothetical protein